MTAMLLCLKSKFFKVTETVSNTFWQYQEPSFLQIMYPDVQMVTI